MASFTDSIPTFNPYVQQLPVDAMVEVGMTKQQQYDEGIQAIQTQIDSVASSDVIREQDKEYLQSKLDDLGTRLGAVAAGDFSSTQLVNSVKGMVGEVSKDSTLQNAIVSTQRVRQALADRETAKQAGETSVENDWYLQKGISEYMLNEDPDASYNGEYTPYIDLTPKFTEVLESLHEEGYTEQIPWKTDVNGNINYGETAAAMVEQGYEGISSAKIQNALRASLTATELQQLQISGEYQFKDYGTQELVAYATSNYEQQAQAVTDKIAELKKYAERNSGDAEVYNATLSTIKELEDSIKQGGVLYQNYENQISLAQTNPNAMKGEIYKNGFIEQFAEANAWENNTTKYVSNPFLEADHWERTFALSEAKFDLDMQKFQYQQEQDALDRIDARAKAASTSGTSQDRYTTTSDAVAEEMSASEVITKSQEALLSKQNEALQLTNRLMTALGGNEQDVALLLDDYMNGKDIKPKLKDDVASLIDAKKEIEMISISRQNAYNATAASYDEKAYIADKNTILSDKDNYVTMYGGERIEFTPEEVADVIDVRMGLGSEMGLSEREQLLAQFYDNDPTIARKYSDYMTLNDDRSEEYNATLKEELLKRSGQYVPKTTMVSNSETQQKQHYKDVAAMALQNRISNNTLNEGADEKTLNEWLTDSELQDLQFGIRINDNTTQMVVGSGSEQQFIDLKADEIAQLDDVSSPSEVKLLNWLIGLEGKTNVANGSAAGAYWQSYDLPNIKKYQVVADVEANTNNLNKLYPIIQINTEDGWKKIELNGSVWSYSVDEFLYNLNDDDIEAAINEQLPSIKGKTLVKK